MINLSWFLSFIAWALACARVITAKQAMDIEIIGDKFVGWNISDAARELRAAALSREVQK